MGKRELLLIVAFAVLGVAVYQITASPPAPGTEGAGLSAIWHNLQRHIKGNQAVASTDLTASAPADGVRELRITITRASNITVTGEDRRDVAAVLHVTARGFDDAEARAAAAATTVRFDRAGDTIVVRPDVATTRPRSAPPPQLALTLKVPRQLAIRIDSNIGSLAIANVAAIDVTGSRGEVRVSSIGGSANISHSGGQLTIDGCGELRLTNRGGRVTIRNVSGPASIESTGGRLDVEGLRAETRIDARNARTDVTLASAAQVTIYSTSEDIAITPAAAGYTLDAVASDGRVTIADDAEIRPSGSSDEQRASGAVRGGGPPLVLRATHANITVRAHSGK